jgi:hypothetical protein
MDSVLATDGRLAATEMAEKAEEAQHQCWAHVHVNWTAVWVGALAALSAALVFGLVGTALGAHLLTPENRVVELRQLGFSTLIFSVCGAFFSFAIGGWVAGRMAGILHSEPGMVHGAIVTLLAVPMLLVAIALGAGSLFGGWYTGLAGTPAWAAAPAPPFARPEPLGTGATSEELTRYRTQVAEYHARVRQWQEDTPRVARNAAIGGATALLLGLAGSVLGGWMASGEPMNFSHFRSRTPRYHFN